VAYTDNQQGPPHWDVGYLPSSTEQSLESRIGGQLLLILIQERLNPLLDFHDYPIA
jgi:hypothetical protein